MFILHGATLNYKTSGGRLCCEVNWRLSNPPDAITKHVFYGYAEGVCFLALFGEISSTPNHPQKRYLVPLYLGGVVLVVVCSSFSLRQDGSLTPVKVSVKLLNS